MKALLAWAAAAGLSTLQVLDDRLSPQSRVHTELQWTHPIMKGLTPEQLTSMSAQAARVEIRLDTAAHLGMPARIYLRLPVNVPNLASTRGLRLSWTTDGFFTAGSTEAGQRALLYEGPILAPILSDRFDFEVQLNGQDVLGTIDLDLIYEIERL